MTLHPAESLFILTCTNRALRSLGANPTVRGNSVLSADG